MSQTDGNSSDGDDSTSGGGGRNPAHTGAGCYRNYEHVASNRVNVTRQVRRATTMHVHNIVAVARNLWPSPIGIVFTELRTGRRLCAAI